MEQEHSPSPTGFCGHDVDAAALAQIGPICAAAGLEVHRLRDCADPAQRPRAIFYSLARCPDELPNAATFLVGTADELTALYERAAGTDLQVVILPQAQQWLLSVLGEERHGPSATLTVVAGSIGGVGTSTVAALTALRAAQAGRRILLIDGTATPTPHVGISAALTPASTAGHGWDEVLQMPDLPAVTALKTHLPQRKFPTGSVHWIAARTARQRLPVFQLKAFVRRYRRHFDGLIIDAGTPERGATLAADRHLLVSGINAQADAACQFLEAPKVPWQVVLNGAAAPGWHPFRCAELSTHQVIGRIRKLSLGRTDTAKLARTKTLFFLDDQRTEPSLEQQPEPEASAKTARTESVPRPRKPVGQEVGAHGGARRQPGAVRERPWLPELPPPTLLGSLLSRRGRTL